MQATSRPEHIWPEVWSNASNNSRQKEKPHAATEKSKPDKSRQLRGIVYVGFNDMEFTDTMKNARKKLEVQMESAMPCKS